MENKKRLDISIMRIAATLAVVLLHTNNTLCNNTEFFKLSYKQYIFFSTSNYLMNWAVPIFFMITGYLLLDENRNINYKDCLFKYSKRIFLALFLFGIPFSIIEMIMNNHALSFIYVIESIYNVFLGKSWSHLWYLYYLIGIYLIIPFLKSFTDNTEKYTYRYVLSVLFIFNFIIIILNRLFNIEIAFKILIESFPVFYVLLGQYFKKYFLNAVKIKNIIFILLMGIAIIIAINMIAAPNSKIYLGYDSPVIALLAITIFLLFHNRSCYISEFIWKIDRLCFGVYLIHPVFINLLYKGFKITPISFGKIYPIISVLMWLGFVVISFVFSWVLNKIPILKKHVL